MEEVIESTFSLLSLHHEHVSSGTEKTLKPIHLLTLLDIKATWFKKWMVCIPQCFSSVYQFSMFYSIFSYTFFCLSACLSPSLSTGATVGTWFSDFWRENTSVWWVTCTVINIATRDHKETMQQKGMRNPSRWSLDLNLVLTLLPRCHKTSNKSPVLLTHWSHLLLGVITGVANQQTTGFMKVLKFRGHMERKW